MVGLSREGKAQGVAQLWAVETMQYASLRFNRLEGCSHTASLEEGFRDPTAGSLRVSTKSECVDFRVSVMDKKGEQR